MVTALRMPEVAAGSTHAVLSAWSVAENDVVRIGDCMAEIETDKAVVELNAEAPGRVARLLFKAGDEVRVGSVIAVIVTEGESSDVEDFLAHAAVPLSLRSGQAPVNPAVEQSHGAADPGKSQRHRRSSSPLARRIAARSNVDLGAIQGSGPGGRIVRRDVEAAIPLVSASIGKSGMPSTAAARSTETPHTRVRKAIARRLQESKQSIPHFYLKVVCDCDRLLSLRSEINALPGRKISINDLLIRAAALALQEIPDFNVGWTDGAMRRFRDADIAVAVATPEGLFTPVVRSAQSKPLSAISAEVAELARRAREGQLRPDEYEGGSFSITNLGMHGVREFSAIINPPQSAILAVGVVRRDVVVRDGRIECAQVVTCTLSVDHRAIDGALAATWLGAFQQLIEHPSAILV